MGKDKRLVIISGFNIRDNNRGTAALGYGSLYFLREKGWLKDDDTLVNFRVYKNPLKKEYRKHYVSEVKAGNVTYRHIFINVLFLEKLLFDKLGIYLPFTHFGKLCKGLRFVAAINGGDGFSDIYSTSTFLSRLPDTLLAMKLKRPVIQLPQTLGPFKDATNYKLAEDILKYSSKVYVRDKKFTSELDKMGVKYEETKDLSYYMQPEPWNIEIKPDAIGINVSGLAYSNHFRTLQGEFKAYPELINELIAHFQKMGKPVYLIPHSYCYGSPETDNDDMVACKLAFEKLTDKDGAYFIDKDLISPQVKYVISKMTFFIGTRMHANFAAIYTHVPLFGLAYSYKFEGAFNANGIYNRTTNIVGLKEKDIPNVIEMIDKAYKEDVVNGTIQ